MDADLKSKVDELASRLGTPPGDCAALVEAGVALGHALSDSDSAVLDRYVETRHQPRQASEPARFGSYRPSGLLRPLVCASACMRGG